MEISDSIIEENACGRNKGFRPDNFSAGLAINKPRGFISISNITVSSNFADTRLSSGFYLNTKYALPEAPTFEQMTFYNNTCLNDCTHGTFFII